MTGFNRAARQPKRRKNSILENETTIVGELTRGRGVCPESSISNSGLILMPFNLGYVTPAEPPAPGDARVMHYANLPGCT
ncbi:hypothetical protein EVAR_75611_1 [Eumeta japonica]|uniref:Uncharacterized protein n=1 Tax=Eumeta variegata TaxID=151549 RepID=A0A4C1U021_EUMVA|nr:hypothetical protein EVAR_75611_1 [Eumeta japonica]